MADPASGRDGVLASLLAGNRRWVAGDPPVWSVGGTRFPLGDHRPAAAVLACADARAPVDLIFDQPSGVLFVVRLAGNPATPEAVASLRFAVDALRVPLVLVLGHESCGAMQATCRVLAGDADPGTMEPIVRHLAPAVRATAGGGPVPADDVAFERMAVATHARGTAKDLAEALGVPVGAAVYQLHDGVVRVPV